MSEPNGSTTDGDEHLIGEAPEQSTDGAIAPAAIEGHGEKLIFF